MTFVFVWHSAIRLCLLQRLIDLLPNQTSVPRPSFDPIDRGTRVIITRLQVNQGHHYPATGEPGLIMKCRDGLVSNQ